MFERLNALNEKRTALYQELAQVNGEIDAEFRSADARIAQLRRECGLDEKPITRLAGSGRRGPRSAEERALLSRRMKDAHARKKASGEPWSAYHTKAHGAEQIIS